MKNKLMPVDYLKALRNFERGIRSGVVEPEAVHELKDIVEDKGIGSDAYLVFLEKAYEKLSGRKL